MRGKNITSRKKFLNFIFITLFGISVIVAVGYWTGMESFLFAWVLNFMLMMVLQAFTRTIQPDFFNSNYYNHRKWEKEGEMYRYFGVNIFRKLLVWIGWEKINKKENPVNKSQASLRNLEYSSRQSEFSHLLVFGIVMVIAIYVAIEFGIVNSIWLLVLNILLNLYPVMLQRYNRPRYLRLLALKRKWNRDELREKASE